MDGDGQLTMSDALALLRHTLNLLPLPDEYVAYADINGDGVVDTSDALMLMRAVLGIIS